MSTQNGGGERLRRPMSSMSGNTAEKILVKSSNHRFLHYKGLNLLARSIWYRSKAQITRVLYHQVSSTSTAKRSNPLPHEIIEMIIDHFTHDIRTLKSFSLTCYPWYIAAFPFIHRTLVLSDSNGSLKSLSNRHAMGLLPFTREIRILQRVYEPHWFLPQFFSHRNSRHFSTLTNVQSLTVQCLDIISFIPGLEQDFGHLSSTLRSLTLDGPRCTPLQLSHFISLFPNLDDIVIRSFIPVPKIFGEVLVSWTTPKLQGKLELVSSDVVETWEDLAVRYGLQFRSVRFLGVSNCVPVILAACADTLETLRIEPLLDHGTGPRVRLSTHRSS